MISQSSLSGEILDALYKAKDIKDREYENASKWITDIIKNPDRAKQTYCEVCGHSDWKLERHHVRGRKHGNENITVCCECHNRLTDSQRLWDRSWLATNSKNKNSFLSHGIIDICRLRYEKTYEEIYKLMAEKLTEGFSYD